MKLPAKKRLKKLTLKFFGCALATLTPVVLAQPSQALDLCGLLNSQGKWIIKPEYTSIAPLGKDYYLAMKVDFSAAMVQRPSQASLFDRDGNPVRIIIPDGYNLTNILLAETKGTDNAPDYFAEIEKDGNAGICDKAGKIIIQPQFMGGIRYNEGLFNGRLKNTLENALVDRQGHIIAKMPGRWTTSEGPYQNGFLILQGRESGADNFDEVHFYKKNGSEANFPRISKTSGFSQGYAAVELVGLNHEGVGYGFVDTSGKLVPNQKFLHCENFVDGIAVVAKDSSTQENPSCGAIDLSFKFVIKPDYWRIIHAGRNNWIGIKGGKSSLLNQKGAMLFTVDGYLTPSEGNLLALDKEIPSSISTQEKPAGTAGFVDLEGHVFKMDSWPVPGVVAPVYEKDENDVYWAGLFDGRNWLTEKQFHKLYQLADGRWIATGESLKFETAEWQSQQDRTGQLRKLLRQYNLIGMPRLEVEALLGVEESTKDRLRYRYGHRTCTRGGISFDINLLNDKTISWSFTALAPTDTSRTEDNTLETYSSNVIFKDGKYVPKS
ncbi:MAG: WG repeat-containing protein [Cyanobacteria bacterium REEB67]|nr:WG repeat-containing protein [Cyanobacteria bacterium REEB67]